MSRPAVIVRNPGSSVVDGDSGGSGEIPEPTVKVWMGEENGTSHGGRTLPGPALLSLICPVFGGRFMNPNFLFFVSFPKLLRRISAGAAFLLIAAAVVSSCSGRKTAEMEKSPPPTPPAAEVSSIAVFVPGVVAGSPTYEMMVNGVNAAVAKHPGVKAAVVEGGYNQGEWLTKVTSLASSGKYDLIITSNPAMPEICSEAAKAYPASRFLILDGNLEGNQSIYTFRFNQKEQGYLAGYFAGLLAMEAQTLPVKVGLIAGQEYPDMVQSIRPGFLTGAKSAAGEAELDFRVVGNWYDANKGAELARDMYRTGTESILAIAGGANQGVVSAARDAGKSVVWFDSPGYDAGPGVVLGGTRIYLDRAAEEKTTAAIEGTLSYGSAEQAGIAEGYIDFAMDHPAYRQFLSSEIRSALEEHLDGLKFGRIHIQE